MPGEYLPRNLPMNHNLNNNKVNNSLAERSLGRKYLSDELWNKLKGKKTSSGFTLAHALQSDIANPDSSIGLYAGDAETYDIFSDIFDPVISAYHGFEKNARHRSDLKKCDLPNPDTKKKYIISTRIRTARNIKGFAFPPFISGVDRKSVENKIISALEVLPEDYRGTYISIKETASKKSASFDRESASCDLGGPYPAMFKNCRFQNLIFKKGNRFQEAAGINRNWPDSRGVFFSHEGQFILWINEEDHLRIISMEKGGNLAAAFNRLTRGLTLLENILPFARHPRYGYLSSCPSNLGTGMRAGVHILLPKLFNHQQKLYDAAGILNLQVRGTQGEKTAVKSGIFDISNSRRLGITERECIEVLYNGVCKIIALEESL